MNIGKNIIYYEKVSSTNIVAHDYIIKNRESHGTIISAGYQTDGRGQRDNTWYSDPFMNLIMSVILQPGFLLPGDQFYISKIVSLSIIDTLSEFDNSFSIKWPNDIYYRGDKIAGILIEHSILGNKITASVAGIGLNINQPIFPDTLPNPVSLSIITGQSHNVQDLQSTICENLQIWYSRLEKRNHGIIDQAYSNYLYQRGIRAEYTVSDGKFAGTIEGVNESGQLLITDDKGEIRTFSFREVEFSIGNRASR